jgi:hypothetical protein
MATRRDFLISGVTAAAAAMAARPVGAAEGGAARWAPQPREGVLNAGETAP